MGHNKNQYTYDFYTIAIKSSQSAARKIAPIVIKLCNPRSIVDIGCGLGIWLSVFKENGVSLIQGYDVNDIDSKMLFVSKENLKKVDFEKVIPVDKKFDMGLCLEVAEHIDRKYADQFVRSLTQLSDVILFAAAIPFQGGVNHVNEQWPHYWIDKFSDNNFVAIDFIRPLIWNDTEIDYWYKQNMMLFIEKQYYNKNLSQKCKNFYTFNTMSIVHPDLFTRTAMLDNISLKPLLVLIVKALLTKFKSRIFFELKKFFL